MKNIMALPIAALATLMAASSSAYKVPAHDDNQIEKVPAMSDLHVERTGLKDLDGSYLTHSATIAHHGTPGITLRFHNSAARERSFLVSARDGLTSETWKEFSVPPGGTTEFTLFMPLALERGGEFHSIGLNLQETTPKADNKRESLSYVQLNGFESISDDSPSVLLSAGIDAKKLAADMTSALEASKYTQRYKESSGYRSRSKTGEKAKYEFTGRQFTFPASDWPRDWRCYTTYDSVFITAEEYGELNAEAKSALDVYRLLGGAVIATSGADGFASGPEAVKALKAVDDSCEALTGDLNISRYHYSYAKTNIVNDLKRIPIEAKSTIPVKTLLLVLAVFSLVIVPLVIFRSVQRNVRMRLLFLLPGSAAVFAVLIAVFAYAFFGTTPTVRLQSVTFLDQATKKALTRGQLSLFSPVSIDGRMSFPLDAAFRMRNVGGELSPSLKVTDVQTLHGGWVKPLVTSFFDFERACDRSERLDFRVSQSGGVTVVNLLGANITKGYANVGGKLWKFHDVPPGGEAAAEPMSEKPNTPSKDVSPINHGTVYGRDWPAVLQFVDNEHRNLGKGEYAAVLDGSPFFPNPVTRGKTHTSAASLVVGRFKEVAE